MSLGAAGRRDVARSDWEACIWASVCAKPTLSCPSGAGPSRSASGHLPWPVPHRCEIEPSPASGPCGSVASGLLDQEVLELLPLCQGSDQPPRTTAAPGPGVPVRIAIADGDDALALPGHRCATLSLRC